MDQILYYVRSEHKENDYLIQEVELQKCITEAALKNREEILTYEIQLEVDNVEESVMTDSKWMIFILNQLVNNCIKYRDKKKKSRIRFFMEVFPNCQVLHVWDNGIGIPSSDLPKVFDKSFTGKNGRLIHGNSYAESTGMGLYIVKQLCDSLGHRVELVSEEGMYTEVRITFAKNDYFDVRNGSNVTKL
jgi:signal transduction histidine kinase